MIPAQDCSKLRRCAKVLPRMDSGLSSKCGFATLLDPHGGRPASAGLGALRRNTPLGHTLCAQRQTSP